MRLTRFDRLIGNPTTKNIIMKSLLANGFPQVSSFTGAFGTGKSSSAEISALRLTCDNPSGPEPCGKCKSCVQGISAIMSNGMSRKIRKINLASIQENTDVKNLIVETFKIDNGNDVCVRIFEEAHSLSRLHQTALYEELERIPENLYVMFVSSRPEDLTPELRSRAVEFKFNRLTPKQSRLLIDDESSRMHISLSANTKDLIKNHSAGVPRTIVKDLEFIAKNSSTINEDEFNDYFGDINYNSIRFMLKFFGNIGEAMKVLDSILEKLTPSEFLVKFKEYLMECSFLAKDISYRETPLTAEDKRFSKSVGFSGILQIYSTVSAMPYRITLCDLQFCVIKCCSIVAKSMKVNAKSEGLDDDEAPKQAGAIEIDLNSKRNRAEVLSESKAFTGKLSESSFSSILNESST